MAFKSSVLVLGVLLVAFLLISSEVAARDLAEDTNEENSQAETADQITGCRPPFRCCRRCCPHPGTEPDVETLMQAEAETADQITRYRPPFRCCRRCCKHPGTEPDVETLMQAEAETADQITRCRPPFRCCRRCCKHPGTETDVETQSEPHICNV